MSLSSNDSSEGIVPPRVNGRTGEVLRWVLGLVFAGLTSYFVAQAEVQTAITRIDATQKAQFDELLRRLSIMQDDIRELRRGR